ncbi:YHYH protein [Rhodobacteraceae bacterium D3-12]|nr:YHYH protein [Rhodobacteraceae bacterium D3-12]
MNRLSFATLAPIAALSWIIAMPAMAHEQEGKLHEIAHLFDGANVVAGPTEVDCTLSRGTKTKCFQITVKAQPKTYEPGPWCPTSVSDGADKGGIWLKDGEVHDVDGAFVKRLAELYGDDVWQLFDPVTGKINVTDTKASCEAAARPDVDEKYNNYCVECRIEYMPSDATVTYSIPLEPQDTWRSNDTRMAGSGVALNGIRLDGPAPVDHIIGAHTIAPFDDCGGHVNLHVGYHYHAVTDCLDGLKPQEGDAAMIGIAMDGYSIFAHLLKDGSKPTDLDKCNGHTSESEGYHYHAGAPGSNAILPCLKAEAGCVTGEEGAVCDASKRPPRP